MQSSVMLLFLFAYITRSELDKYIPKTLIGQHSPSDWRNKLLEGYSKLQTKSQDEMKALYMTHIKKWAYYGSSIFVAKVYFFPSLY